MLNWILIVVGVLFVLDGIFALHLKLVSRKLDKWMKKKISNYKKFALWEIFLGAILLLSGIAMSL